MYIYCIIILHIAISIKSKNRVGVVGSYRQLGKKRFISRFSLLLPPLRLIDSSTTIFRVYQRKGLPYLSITRLYLMQTSICHLKFCSNMRIYIKILINYLLFIIGYNFYGKHIKSLSKRNYVDETIYVKTYYKTRGTVYFSDTEEWVQEATKSIECGLLVVLQFPFSTLALDADSLQKVPYASMMLS